MYKRCVLWFVLNDWSYFYLDILIKSFNEFLISNDLIFFLPIPQIYEQYRIKTNVQKIILYAQISLYGVELNYEFCASNFFP